MEFPVATQRLYGEVSYKTVGVEAICSVFPWPSVHVLVRVFLFSATGFLSHKVFFLCAVSFSPVGWLVVPSLQTFFTSRYKRGHKLTQGHTISNLFKDWMDYWSDNPRPIKLSPDSFSLIHREQSKVCAMSDQAEIEVYTEFCQKSALGTMSMRQLVDNFLF